MPVGRLGGGFQNVFNFITLIGIFMKKSPAEKIEREQIAGTEKVIMVQNVP
jgi:hypothetical protein